MAYSFIRNTILNESKPKKKLEQLTLPYKKDDLEPAMSKDTINYHFSKLYKGYVDRYNEGEGDPDFNEAGAYLHNIYFSQFCEPRTYSKPEGSTADFIAEHFKTWDNFKDKFEKEAMKIQGSGWIYLSKKGEIKTIVNHEIRSDILILVDWWEHAWALDYQADKKKYLKNIWTIFNWPIIDARLA